MAIPKLPLLSRMSRKSHQGWAVNLTWYPASLQACVASYSGVFTLIRDSSNPHACFAEHLGLIPPQTPDPKHQRVTSNMKPAPYPYDYDFGSKEDAMVADPVAESTTQLWQQTAKKNREIFTEIFKTVPNNIVRDWATYEVWTRFDCLN